MLFKNIKKTFPLVQQVRHDLCCPFAQPRHLICFKQWNAEMVMQVLSSALSLKRRHRDTHNVRLNALQDSKIMILQEENEPVLNMAVSKAATLLGATDVSIHDQLLWDHDYNGSIFAFMSDAIFVTTSTHTCVQRFALKSPVPVLCMKSRTHASIQSLATVMAIIESFGTMRCLKVAYLGPPHPVLNSYLLLCPMLGANIRFKCCCKECPVSPLLLKAASEDEHNEYHTEVKQCSDRAECLQDGSVFISGPSCSKKDKISEFKLMTNDIDKCTSCRWIYFHTTPRGEEVDDQLFYHSQSKTFDAFENMHYIAAALMAYCIKGFLF